MKQDPAALERVNGYLQEIGHRYRGTVTVKHYLWILLEDVGVEAIRRKVVRPLTGLRVAPFYGCHILRPQSVYGLTGSDEASSIEKLCQALGAEPVEYDGKTQCCGFHVVVASEDVSLRLSGNHLASAKKAKADVMVTPCPLCHTVLDAFQPKIEKRIRTQLDIPILHLAQLVGLALGMSPEDLKLSQHVVPVRLGSGEAPTLGGQQRATSVN